MIYTDTLFLFCFLPISLLLYHICKDNFQKYILLMIGFVFYASSSLSHFMLLIISVGMNILLGQMINKLRNKKLLQGGVLGIGLFYNLSVLLYFKYADFALLTFGRLTGTDVTLKNMILPLGLSFFTFRAISYLADIYYGKIIPHKNPVYAALYLTFFAQVQSGPLSRYSDMQSDGATVEIERRRIRFEDFSEGTYRFIIGFNKKILIANTLSNITSEAFAAGADNMSTTYAWLGAVCYSLQLFFDFSGYSDMAIGISTMFGYHCPENFNYPYMTESVSQFWRRWHITLGTWFRDYVYIPLGGSRVKERSRLYINLLIVWLLTGLWHGASWNFVLWGLLYFLMIAFEKRTKWPMKFKSKSVRIIYRVFTLFFINFQWVIFGAGELRAGLKYVQSMLYCPPNPLADARALFLLKDNIVFILAAVILSFPVVPWLEERMGQKNLTKVIWELAVIFVNGFLFIWAVSFVVAGRNNPFVYANF